MGSNHKRNVALLSCFFSTSDKLNRMTKIRKSKFALMGNGDQTYLTLLGLFALASEGNSS